MKKLLFLLLLSSLSLFSQETKEFGNFKIKYEKFKGKSNFGTWYEMSEGTFVIKHNSTTVGVKSCIETTEEILKALNIDFLKPYQNKTFLSSIVKDIHDYEVLKLTINTEDSIVDYIWVNEKYFVILKMDKDLYTVGIMSR